MSTERHFIIRLTQRRPIRINTANWPVIASVESSDCPGMDFQANRAWCLVVRQHERGFVLVYGMDAAGDGGAFAGFIPAYAGYLLDDDDDLIGYIGRVSREICHEELGPLVIAELPAVDFDTTSLTTAQVVA